MSEAQAKTEGKPVKFLWSFNADLHRKMKAISTADNRSIAAEVRALIVERHKELFPQDGTNLDHAVTYPIPQE